MSSPRLISRICERLLPPHYQPCGGPAVWAYETNTRGWMALCRQCGEKHQDYAKSIQWLVQNGEQLAPLK